MYISTPKNHCQIENDDEQQMSTTKRFSNKKKKKKQNRTEQKTGVFSAHKCQNSQTKR